VLDPTGSRGITRLREGGQGNASDGGRVTVHAAAVQSDRAGAAEPSWKGRAATSPPRGERADVRGRFLYAGHEKLYVRGATYGTFAPGPGGDDYPPRRVVADDLAAIAAAGLNALRTYTVPPGWLLDAAAREGIRVMVGLPWEQHVTFLDDRGRAASIERRVREGIRTCAGHPAVLCYAVGNEIPAPIVRWHGRRRIERHIERLCDAAREEDPSGLVTYVNYPSTEYLDLPFLDVVSFNVYLERRADFEAYLARLHNLAGDRPLLLTELGLDSRRNGLDGQAESIDWQLRSTFASGCAGGMVFAWTDEWHRGGQDVDDWDFGLTDRQRRPKPALAAASGAFADVPIRTDLAWPRVSVVVCSHNGERTLCDCCEGVNALRYPRYEAILVDDGSTDATAAIGREHGLRVISTENRGLSSARNTGMQAAAGEIVAYVDDDARPDPDWLTYLVWSLLRSEHAGVGGPNLAPPADGLVPDCVANAPGGPVHVLVSDEIAEHLPGCNMAFWRPRLEAIGGFDEQFRVAGDDVDLCWRLQARGWTLGYSPAAVVWHRRRNSVRRYWRQQRGYGRAEALLERKWPERYNVAGHPAWVGRVYGGRWPALGRRRSRIYHGAAGTAPFQSLYSPGHRTLDALPTMPEWYLVLAALAVVSALALTWRPLGIALGLLVLGIAALLLSAAVGAAAARFAEPAPSPAVRIARRLLTGGLFVMQPLARLAGRLQGGLTPWRRHAVAGRPPARMLWRALFRRRLTGWSERWHPVESWLSALEAGLRSAGVAVAHSDDFATWDLEARLGPWGWLHVSLVVEEHGNGRQLAHVRAARRARRVGVGGLVVAGALAGAAAMSGAWLAAVVLTAGPIVLVARAELERACAVAGLEQALLRHVGPEGSVG
jgi:O-antigen biosynthesis protein